MLLSPVGRLALRRPAASLAHGGRRSRALHATAVSKKPHTAGDGTGFDMPFKSLMAANRGEIAVRIMRAGNELGLRTVGIFSKEDRFTQHRWGWWCFYFGLRPGSVRVGPSFVTHFLLCRAARRVGRKKCFVGLVAKSTACTGIH